MGAAGREDHGQARAAASDLRRGFQIPEVDREGDAEDHDPVAQRPALPRRPKAIDTTAYPDMDEFYADLARVYREEIRDLVDAGCRYLQVDEVNMAFLCDPSIRDFVRGLGEDPEKLPHTYAKLINEATAARHKDMTVCMHLCRGNARSHWVADGGYEPVAETLFNEFDVNGYFLEYDSSRAGDFRPLRFVPKGKIVVLGLVTTKKGALEKKVDIKRRIDEASRFVPIDQLALSPQCGFARNAEGNMLA